MTFTIWTGKENLGELKAADCYPEVNSFVQVISQRRKQNMIYLAFNTIHCQPYLPKSHSSFNSIVKPPKETSTRHVTEFVM